MLHQAYLRIWLAEVDSKSAFPYSCTTVHRMTVFAHRIVKRKVGCVLDDWLPGSSLSSPGKQQKRRETPDPLSKATMLK